MVSGCCELYNDHLKIPHKGEFAIMIMNFTPPQSSAGGSVKMVSLGYLDTEGQELYTDTIQSNTMFFVYVKPSLSSGELNFEQGKWKVGVFKLANNISYSYISMGEFEIGTDGTVLSVTPHTPNDPIGSSSSRAYASSMICTIGEKPLLCNYNGFYSAICYYFIKTE